MTDLSNLPNIGKKLEEKLVCCGITNAAKLRELGSINVFSQIKSHFPDSCICSLMALEGAIQNIRWHNLPQAKKEELKQFFKQF